MCQVSPPPVTQTLHGNELIPQRPALTNVIIRRRRVCWLICKCNWAHHASSDTKNTSFYLSFHPTAPDTTEFPTWRRRESVKVWLKRLGVVQYEPALMANGYDHLDFMGSDILSRTDLEEMGIKVEHHLTVLCDEIDKNNKMKGKCFLLSSVESLHNVVPRLLAY